MAAEQVLAAEATAKVNDFVKRRDDFLTGLVECRALVAAGIVVDERLRDLCGDFVRPPREWVGAEAAATRASAAIEARLMRALVSGGAEAGGA